MPWPVMALQARLRAARLGSPPVAKTLDALANMSVNRGSRQAGWIGMWRTGESG